MPLTISKDLLSQAKADVSAKKIPKAITATDSAQILLARAMAGRVPAKPDDFATLVADLNVLTSSANPALTQTVSQTRVVLANYKSALESQPKSLGQEAAVEKSFTITVEAATIDKSSLPGSVLMAPPGATFDHLTTPFFRRLSNAPTVDNIGFVNAAEALDGFRWRHVAFVNVLIRYDGGELELVDTRFIKCTFQMPDSPRAAKVATYVALNQPYSKIGPDD
jgi:hypothetical protein